VKKWQVALAIAGAVAVANGVLSKAWPPINDVTTGATTEYPDLQPRVYTLPRDQVFEAAAATAHATSGWDVTSVDPAAGEIQAVAHVRWTPFRDDVTIRVTDSHGQAVVNVRSRSRVGRGDLGVNARRIRAYLRALDDYIERNRLNR
jgi:uncharacterized protein (DUF1499 family)